MLLCAQADHLFSAIVMFTFGIFVTLTLACLYAMIFHPLNGKRHWPLIIFILCVARRMRRAVIVP